MRKNNIKIEEIDDEKVKEETMGEIKKSNVI